MKTLRLLLPLAFFIFLCLVGFTYWKTGSIGLWPAPPKKTAYDRDLDKLNEERAKLEKELGELKDRNSMGGVAEDREALQQKIMDIEQAMAELDVKIGRLKRFRDAARESGATR